jgi:hypothetical protein
MQRIALALGCAALLLVMASPASAGGFAVTTLDSVPAPLVAGQTYHIGFMLRQHGITPVRDATPSIVIRSGRLRQAFPAKADGVAGHYMASVTFPSDGEWTWSVDQSPFPAPQELGAVTVAAPSATSTPVVKPPAEFAMLGVFGVGGVGLALSVGLSRSSRRGSSSSPSASA